MTTEYSVHHLGGMAYIGGSSYVLAQCDSLGMICKAVYIAERPEYPGTENAFADINLIIQPFDLLVLQINGEPVYTSP